MGKSEGSIGILRRCEEVPTRLNIRMETSARSRTWPSETLLICFVMLSAVCWESNSCISTPRTLSEFLRNLAGSCEKRSCLDQEQRMVRNNFASSSRMASSCELANISTCRSSAPGVTSGRC
jgi:hypothetical protein